VNRRQVKSKLLVFKINKGLPENNAEI